MPPSCAAPDSGTMVAEFDLGAAWASDASGGAKSLASLPLSVPAIAAGVIGYFRIYDATGTVCHMQGTVSAPGGGGPMFCDNPDTAVSQHVVVGGFTLSAPGA
jgi:hypothetical protein